MAVKVKDFKYERVDIDAEVKFLTDAVERVKNAKSAAEIAEIRDEVNAYTIKAASMTSLSYIRHSINVKDEFYSAEQDYYDENLPKVSAVGAEFSKAIVNSKHAAALEKLINPIIMRNMRAQVKVMDERIVDDLVEENKLVSEYDKLMANMTYEWEGKKYTRSEMKKFTVDKDRDVRRRASVLMGETIQKYSDELDGLYDKLVKVRTRMAQKMGFKNYVEMGDLRMMHIGYGRKEIKVFRESVLESVVPALTRLKAELAKRMGIDRVHIYDNANYIEGGNIDPVGTAEDLFAAAQRMYDDMSPILGGFFREMCEAEAFDYASREGKMPGGYADMLFAFGQPFIFANFNGTMDDVGVLTHEFGHALAFKRAYVNDIDVDLFVGGMETAETHSMAMEQLCNNYNSEFYGDRAKEATYQQLFDAFNFLPYGVIVDYFQELVYSKPELTPSERKAMWLELEAKFRPYIDMSDVPYTNIGGLWQNQIHIYQSPFYYIDYCLSTCMALQFGELATDDFKEALKRYLAFVEAGGTKDIDELAHAAGFMSPFDKGALKSLSEKIEKHITALQ